MSIKICGSINSINTFKKINFQSINKKFFIFNLQLTYFFLQIKSLFRQRKLIKLTNIIVISNFRVKTTCFSKNKFSMGMILINLLILFMKQILTRYLLLNSFNKFIFNLIRIKIWLTKKSVSILKINNDFELLQIFGCAI